MSETANLSEMLRRKFDDNGTSGLNRQVTEDEVRIRVRNPLMSETRTDNISNALRRATVDKRNPALQRQLTEAEVRFDIRNPMMSET
jgi:hypothetical protein